MSDRKFSLGLVTFSVMLASCGEGQATKAPSYTLYRNSPLVPGVRVHWGSFDAKESDPAYNRNNCEMAARLLNANMAEFAKQGGESPHEGVGFWCEPGEYSEEGSTPSTFEGTFPTDVPEANRVP